LKAYADFTAPIGENSIVAPNISVDLEQNGLPVDVTNFSKTVPQTNLDVTAVEVDIQAKTGTTSKQVVLIDSAPSNGPPTGYRVTGILIDPIAVLVTGKADVLVKIQNLTLPAVDLSGHTTNATFRVAIPYPSGVNGTVAIARVTYSISANPNVQVSPTP
jgi:hypothetical protein